MKRIDTNHYSINKYILFNLYFSNKYNEKEIRAKITRKAYLVDNLKTKILFSTNIISPEKIDIIISRNKIYIRFYKIIIFINLRLKSRELIIKSIVASK